jgi:YbgC/YbaW family acyl-CoA thioester hydrolase
MSFSRERILAVESPLRRQERPVRFQDVDAAGTIYYSRVFDYFGDVYLDLLLSLGLDVPGMLARRELASPLIHAEADYLAPLRFGDQVGVEVALARVGRTSASFAYRIVKDDGVTAVIGQTTHVWVDGETFRPVDVPEALRSRLG